MKKIKKKVFYIWESIISILHFTSFGILSKNFISFCLIGSSGVIVQLTVTYVLVKKIGFDFNYSIPFSVLVAAISNYVFNNIFTFRKNRLKGFSMVKGLIKFLLIISIPSLANILISTYFYELISNNIFWAQIFGITIAVIWNFLISSRFIWKNF